MSTSENPYWRFGLALTSAMLKGQLRFPGGHRPPVGHVVSQAFVGVGVAAADDPAVDDYILARLTDAGIRHVRLDLSPGDESAPAARLLAKLCDSGLLVTLHLVLRAEQAREIFSDHGQTVWRVFVANALDRYGSRIEMVEIGSTTNRQRWTGLSLTGFLLMWDIAWQEVRARSLVLVGPSVTDFEPPWNIGLLALLRQRGQSPDIHSDNLFSERCTEPERYDQKILGHALASTHKFNLIKKARLLARIGANYGVPRLISPAAFWTLPRIERMLPDSEEKQADYLARYLVLCAASGALERAWWGPLICHREGLIDNGIRQYPTLERIACYSSVEGSLADLRVRPAFEALSTFVAMVPEARYEGRQNASPGLEVHAFRSDRQLIHAVWTINGRAAALEDIYHPFDLESARVVNRDGVEFNSPASLVGEKLCYLVWPSTQTVTVRSRAAMLPDVAIAQHLRGRQYFFFRERGWQGVVLAKDAAELECLLQRIHPERISPPRRESTLRHARNVIWTIGDPRDEDAKLVVKQPVRMHLHKKLLDRLKPSKALRSWNGTCELMRRGIAAAPPVAYFERQEDRSLTQNYYVCEHVPAEYTAREMVATFASGQTDFEGVAEIDAYRQLCDYLLRMHGRGVLFRDLSGGNILIRKQQDGQLSFILIDTGRIHVFDGPLTLRQRFADLVRICNKLHDEGRERFLGLYLAALHRRFRWWHRLPFLMYDVKVVVKRRVGRKAIKRLLS